jgi:hypothetical protein
MTAAGAPSAKAGGSFRLVQSGYDTIKRLNEGAEAIERWLHGYRIEVWSLVGDAVTNSQEEGDSYHCNYWPSVLGRECADVAQTRRDGNAPKIVMIGTHYGKRSC